MEQHLWQPMGVGYDASWSQDSDASGLEKMKSHINVAARDYARFGYLFDHEGRIADIQVVPNQWVTDATAVDDQDDPNAAYQYWG